MSTVVVKNIDRADKQTNNILAPSANTTLPPWFKTTTDYNAQIANVCLLALALLPWGHLADWSFVFRPFVDETLALDF